MRDSATIRCVLACMSAFVSVRLSLICAALCVINDSDDDDDDDDDDDEVSTL